MSKREIKFRCFECGEMNYDPMCQFYDSEINFEFKNNIDRNYMQYTGLKDKNGVEIYEGDIVKSFANINKISDPNLTETKEPLYSNKFVEYVRGAFSLSSIEYHQGGCGILDHYTGAMTKDIEVIGNIFENPELLETTHETTS